MQQQDEEAMRMQIELITAPKRVQRYQANSPSIFRPLCHCTYIYPNSGQCTYDKMLRNFTEVGHKELTFHTF